jgi:hypothetical protein
MVQLSSSFETDQVKNRAPSGLENGETFLGIAHSSNIFMQLREPPVLNQVMKLHAPPPP